MTRHTKKRVNELIKKYSTPIGYKNKVPIFKAIKKNEYQMRMFCSHCKSWHNHGLDTELGHRSPHYTSGTNSPFDRTGYYIFLVEGEEKD